MVRMPSRSSAASVARPTPQMIETGWRARKASVSARPITLEAARLVEVGGDLGQELVVGEADRGGDAELALDARLQAGEEDGGRRVVQPLGAGEVEEGLVERERLDRRA